MSTAPEPDLPEDQTVLVVATGIDQDRDTDSDEMPFRLDDDDTILWARRPKKAKLLLVVSKVGSLDQLEDLAAAKVLDELLPLILVPESEEYLRDRFMDDDDDLDLDCLEPIFKTFTGLWYGTPTGGRRASRPSPPRTGPRSTVRRGSRG